VLPAGQNEEKDNHKGTARPLAATKLLNHECTRIDTNKKNPCHRCNPWSKNTDYETLSAADDRQDDPPGIVEVAGGDECGVPGTV